MAMKFDFSGWASRNNMLCSDGRTIIKDAFKDCDGKTVPLVWSHIHDDPDMVLGHAVLENRNEGLYAYCSFNDSKKGQATKHLVEHGDVVSLSIFANQLRQKGSNVLHGMVREVSVVLAGANPGAFIDQDTVNRLALEHGEPFDDEIGVIFTGEPLELYHSDDEEDEKKEDEEDNKEETVEVSKEETKTVKVTPEKEEKSDESEEEDAEDEEDVEEEETDKEDDSEDDEEKDGGKKQMKSTLSHADDQQTNDEKTLKDVVDTMNEEQKNAMYALIGMALEEKDGAADEDEDEEDEEMKHNIFESGYAQDDFLCHSDRMEILEAAKHDRRSLKDTINDFYGEEAVLAHSTPTDGMETPTGHLTYGFNDPSMLFPDYRALNNTPEWISRDQTWVAKVMSAVHKSPFARIKSVFADITAEDARAKGYVTGDQKVEEVFSTLKRTTDPQTIYKKQKMDRDNIVDITDFDVVAWIKAEMRVMLNEEIARAILIGDGRSTLSSDKIKEDCVRPVVSDVDLFNIKVPVTVSDGTMDYKEVIKAVLRARKSYKGSGSPTFFTTEDVLTEMLLLEDNMGQPLYKTEAELATKLRVKEIVTVEAMENYTVTINSEAKPLLGVIVNLTDYNVGTDRGGEVNYFDDFDIDYNQEKYLIETRMSGALVRPFSAMTIYASGEYVNP